MSAVAIFADPGALGAGRPALVADVARRAARRLENYGLILDAARVANRALNPPLPDAAVVRIVDAAIAARGAG